MSDAARVVLVDGTGEGDRIVDAIEDHAAVSVSPRETIDDATDLASDDVACVVARDAPPESDGVALVETVTERAPALPVVVYTESPAERAYPVLSAGAAACLPAPSAGGEWAVLAERVSEVVRTQRERNVEGPVIDYELMVEEAQDGLYAVDDDGRYIMVNRSMVELTGYDREELLGKQAADLLSEESAAEGHERVRELQQSEDSRSDTWEMELVTADGDRVPCEIHYALFPKEGPPYSGLIGVIRDITDRRRREQAITRERERLEQFASVVSHDLRNPLTVAAGRAEIVETRLQTVAEDGDPAELDVADLASQLGQATDAQDRMVNIIEDLLSLARQGDVIGETDIVTLEAVATTAWENVETQDATLSVTGDRSLDADFDRLCELFENLYRNAVEHAGPDVTVRVGPTENGFFVEDTGPGLPSSDRKKVFQRGYSTAQNGTGFGLSIVEQITEAHGWSVTATDRGDGARFEFEGIEHVTPSQPS